jgi:hypothetical protein
VSCAMPDPLATVSLEVSLERRAAQRRSISSVS